MATAKKGPKKVKKAKIKKTKEKIIGNAEHFYEKIGVVTTTLKNALKVGDIVHIKGHTTDFIQTVESIQIEHEAVNKAKKGDGAGIRVNSLVRDHDIIYLASTPKKPQTPDSSTGGGPDFFSF